MARADAGGAGSLRAREGRPVCNPAMSPSFRQWAIGLKPVFNAQGELVVVAPGGSSRGVRPAAILCWLLATACMMLLLTGLPSIGHSGWLAATAAMMAIAAVTTERSVSQPDLRSCRGTIIFPESLDETCRVLLGRAQKAIATVLGSNVRAAGLLSNPVQDELLGQHEWEIASTLRDITKFRALLAENTLLSQAGPMTTDVLAAQRHAIELAHNATAARIAALERYAGQIAAAEAADRDWQRAVELSKLNDKYLDLVARTASDERAASEITALTEQLAAAAKARHDRMHEADLAADVLAWPATPIRISGHTATAAGE